MNPKSILSSSMLILLTLVSCAPALQKPQQDVSIVPAAHIETNVDLSTPVATSTPKRTLAPTITHSLTPSFTPTFTSTPANISMENLNKLALVKRLGKENSFEYFETISLSPSKSFLAISGQINDTDSGVIFDTESFNVVTTFKGLRNLVFSLDESKIAGSNNGDIEIWEISSSNKIQTIKGSPNQISRLAWSSVLNEIAAVDTENNLYIWDAISGEEKLLEVLPSLENFSRYGKLEYSPAGTLLSIIGLDSTLRIWNGEVIKNLQGHTKVITYSSWSPDGEFIATSSNFEQNGYICRMSNFNKIIELFGQYRLNNISWSPIGNQLAAADVTGTIKIWNAKTGGLVTQFDNAESCNFIAWAPDGNKIAGIYISGIKVFDILAGKEYSQIENIQNRNNFLIWVDNGLLLFNYDARAQSWNIETGDTKTFINPEIGTAALLAISPDGKKLAYVENGGKVNIINSENSEVVLSINSGIREQLSDVSWSFNNKMLAVSSGWDQKVVVINIETGEITNIIEDDLFKNNLYIYLAWSKKENELIISAANGKILVWDIKTNNYNRILEMHETSTLDLEISADGDKLAAIGFRGEIYIWNTADWKVVTVFQDTVDRLIIGNLDFSHTGEYLAVLKNSWEDLSSEERSTYQIWNINLKELELAWDGNFAYSMTFSPDGLLIASSDGSIWDSFTGQFITKIDKEMARTVVWTPGSENLIFTGYVASFYGINP